MLQPKLISSYSTPIQQTISLVTFADDVEPVGSFALKLLYPGDIDVREQITACCNEQEAVQKIANDVKEMVKKIISTPGFFLADFKAGLDERYPDDRDLYIVRWDAHELIKGYKLLPGNYKITLEQALSDPTIVKLDIWAPVEGRYIEASNFMILMVEHPDGTTEFLNGLQPDYITSIRQDVFDYFSRNKLNAFKATKRMLLLARAYEDEHMLSIIVPLINSGAGIMYQVISDMNTIVEMTEKLQNSTPYEYIFKEIDGFKNRLSYIHEFEFDEMNIDLLIDHIVKTKPLSDNLINKLDNIMTLLLNSLNNYVLTYDMANNIYPVPKNYTI